MIKAFNNITAPNLASKTLGAESPNRITLSVAGNDEQEKQVVMGLIEQIGFEAIDAGPLQESWRQQSGESAYCQGLDKDALKSALQKADLSKRAANLAMADEIARPYL